MLMDATGYTRFFERLLCCSFVILAAFHRPAFWDDPAMGIAGGNKQHPVASGLAFYRKCCDLR